jgi:hypothetical protein
MNQPDKTEKSWRIRSVFVVRDTCAKFFNPEHLAVDKVMLLFKGRIISKQYIPNKHKCFGIKIYKLCDMTGYIYDVFTWE